LEGSLGPKELRMVMLEFEKCGKIIDHIPGSEGTDWVHIQYQVIIHFRL
jgi:nuclear pore complex protein Nup53